MVGLRKNLFLRNAVESVFISGIPYMRRMNFYLFGLIFLLACSDGKMILNGNNEMAYRKAAWEGLLEEDQKTVTHDWQNAGVSDCNYYQEQREVVCVTFHTNLDSLLGPIIVYIEPVSLEVLGIAPRF